MNSIDDDITDQSEKQMNKLDKDEQSRTDRGFEREQSFSWQTCIDPKEWLWWEEGELGENAL